jgi:hypothetical protein
MGDKMPSELYPLLTSLPFFDFSDYVHRERPGLHHLPITPWSRWWADGFGGKVSLGAAPGSTDPSRGADLLFFKGGMRIGLLGVENASSRLGDRLDALAAYSRRGRGPGPVFCVLWMWANAVEKTDVDEPDEYDAQHPFYVFDEDAPDGLPLLERTREQTRTVSRDSGMLWILAARLWKKGRDRGCKRLHLYTIHRGKDHCLVPRFVYHQ